MTIQNLAMMYAMNVGIEALQGKRGSNLWKDAYKDTALMASMQGFSPDKAQVVDESMILTKGPRGIDVGFEEAIKRQPNVVKQLSDNIPQIPKIQPETDYDKWLKSLPELAKGQTSVSQTKPPAEGWRGWFDKAAGVFKSEQPVAGTGGPATQMMRGQDGKPIRVPVTMAQTDPLKVGLGAGALGTGLYAAGMFDPVDHSCCVKSSS